MKTKARFINLSLFTCLIGLQLQSTAVAQTPYPSNFLWGTAMSAHQVEGLAGGGEDADWHAFEHTLGHTYNNDTADVATDHWRRYQEDLQIGASMGLNTIRTSLAWEKREPAEGQFREDAIDHYRAVFTYMRQLGLRPMITL